MRTLATIPLICLLLATNQPQAGQAAILERIPGVGLLKDLSYTAADLIGNAIGEALQISKRTEETLDYFIESKDPDTKRNVSEIIRSRGFLAEEYDVVTKDGYIITIQRLVNPLIAPEQRSKLKPVMLQHGLLSSSVDWVINSVNVKPERYPREAGSESLSVESSNSIEEINDSQEHPNSLGFYLANRGYDVFLGNSRGNLYGQRHIKYNSWQPKFWDFTFDEQIKYDLPDTIEFIQRLTNHTKVGYVGHSQGTTMIFGLLADRPEYADTIEPVVALAPVAYANNCITPVKYFSVYTPVASHLDMWFGTSPLAVRYLVPLVCNPEVVRKELCENIVFLSTGFNEAELDDSRIEAYTSHMPSGTSIKNIAHWGQEVLTGRFAHFDHGILGNQLAYGSSRPPDYDLTKIRSKSLALFIADNDWLASPKDVARLRADLRIEPFVVHNITEEMPKWNHIDFVYAKHAGQIINTKVEKIFEHFRRLDEQEASGANGVGEESASVA